MDLHLLHSFVTQITLLKLNIAQHYHLSLRGLLALSSLASFSSLTFQELHQQLSIPKSALTGLIDKLHNLGMIERRQDHRDRRRWHVSLTPEGQYLAQAIREQEIGPIQRAFEQFDEVEQAAFLEAIQAVEQELRAAQDRLETEATLPGP